MIITYDPAKNAKNIAERNLPFDLADDLDWETAHVEQDMRFPYPELRYIAMALLEGRLHMICFTPIPDGIRVISFRKANKREQNNYAKITAD